MRLGKKEIIEKFTIPSGIVTTNVSVLGKIAREIPEIGILTTKSIGLNSREGNREPIFAEYAPGCFTNAVGLTNPGAKEFAIQLSKIKIPEDKFLLTSIFGKDEEEFIKVAEILEPFSDGLELNLSCPHAKGYGQVVGQDADLVSRIVSSVSSKVKIPVFVKLSPNIQNIGEIASISISSGAKGIVAINTAGPGNFMIDSYPVLTNKIGGLSGKGILPLGLKCIKEIAETLKRETKETKQAVIIACGGISTAQDVKNYEAAGADFFGIGSALKDMDTEELKFYFSALKKDLQEETNDASKVLKHNASMQYTKARIRKKTNLADDLALIEFDKSTDARAGQFVFLWLPLIGEKPFSVLNNEPFSVLIQKKGLFTKNLLEMKENDVVYIRGPYGKKIKILEEDLKENIFLIGGGTGIAALYLIAKENKNKRLHIFLGAKDKKHLAYVNEFNQLGNVFVSTEDGSQGFKGNIVQFLRQHLQKQGKQNLVFYNCGPKAMIEAAINEEKKYSKEIFYSFDYVTKCGVGICGSCATKDGRRLCVDGPFLKNS